MQRRTGSHSALRDFLTSEAPGGIVLIAAAAAAMIFANSPLRGIYQALLHTPTGPILTAQLGSMNAHLWINDGLMAVFFLLVGLEIKREFVDGRLTTWKQRQLPFIAAGAGMVVPALLYLLVTADEPTLSAGWAIPAATEIAFAIGVLALLGLCAPTSLKLFLTTVAIVDDMGAVAVIAVAYTAKHKRRGTVSRRSRYGRDVGHEPGGRANAVALPDRVRAALVRRPAVAAHYVVN